MRPILRLSAVLAAVAFIAACNDGPEGPEYEARLGILPGTDAATFLLTDTIRVGTAVQARLSTLGSEECTVANRSGFETRGRTDSTAGELRITAWDGWRTDRSAAQCGAADDTIRRTINLNAVDTGLVVIRIFGRSGPDANTRDTVTAIRMDSVWVVP